MDVRAILKRDLKLPSGLTVKNRLAKAGMTEGLADQRGLPDQALERLYAGWAKGGAGLLITGNVMVDPQHLERPGNVVLGGDPDQDALERLRTWAKTAKQGGAALLMQVSHSGRQTPKKINAHPSAPSAIRVNLPGGQFGQPRAMTGEEIDTVYHRFIAAAKAAQAAGFDGVQVHAAHGYLLSEFLSPRANLRTDDYGGTLDNRARLLRRIVSGIRTACGKSFTVSVKLNSADFQRGGFAFEDSLTVAKWLQDDGVDLLEISGGTYEQPRMMDLDGVEPPAEPKRDSTKQREAYFQDFAATLRKQVKIPIMVTGGFRSAEAMAEAIERDGIDLIGLARPMVIDADAPAELLAGSRPELERWEKRLSYKFGVDSGLKPLRVLAGFAVLAWFYCAFLDIGKGRAPDRYRGIYRAFFMLQGHEKRWLEGYRRKGAAVAGPPEQQAQAGASKPKKTATKPKSQGKAAASEKSAQATAPAKGARLKEAEAPVAQAPAKGIAAKSGDAAVASAPVKGGSKAEPGSEPAKAQVPAKGAKLKAQTKSAQPAAKDQKPAKAAAKPKADAAKPAAKAAGKTAAKTATTKPDAAQKKAPAKTATASAPNSAADWPGKDKVRAMLETQAKKGQPLGYGDAVKALGLTWSVTEKPKLEKDLVAISEDCRKQGEPDLAVLVQSGKNGLPGPAYFKALPEAPADEAGKKALVDDQMSKLKQKYAAA
ncbi:MAG: hypothetical protein ACFB22_14570 [Rhodothalassiaceae bacterium]